MVERLRRAETCSVGDNASALPAIVPMDISAPLISDLARHARNASMHAYAPYSKFPVGAAVLTPEGRIYAGANVENASYGLSICAERSAIFRAVADGAKSICAISVYTPTATATPPCGACRQVLAEFGVDVLVICCCDDANEQQRYALAELLPKAFSPGHL
jgi:cytidine deaminase